MKELIEWATSINTFLIVVSIFSKELLGLNSSIGLVVLDRDHSISVGFKRTFVGVLKSALYQHDGVNFGVVIGALLEYNLKFAIDDTILDLFTNDVELTSTDLNVKEVITWEQLSSSESERIHISHNHCISDKNIEHFHARLPKVAL